MFILKRFGAVEPGVNPTLEWIISPPGVTDDLWGDVIRPYKAYFEKYFSSEEAKDILDNPAEYIRDPKKINTCIFDGTHVYITNEPIKNFKLLKENEFIKFTDSIKRTYSRLFSSRIEKLFMDKLGNFGKFNMITKVDPRNPMMLGASLKDFKPGDGNVAMVFHHKCEGGKIRKVDKDMIEAKADMLAKGIERALHYRDEKAYSDLLTNINRIHGNPLEHIDTWNYPPSVLLSQPKEGIARKMFFMKVYRNNKLIFMRHGNIVNYAYIDMMYKLMRQARDSEDLFREKIFGKSYTYQPANWVWVIGIIDVPITSVDATSRDVPPKDINEYSERIINSNDICICSYFHAILLKERFGGVLVYDEKRMHFACMIDQNIYGLGDMSESYEIWDEWKLGTPQREEIISRIN